jgi:putative N6-adenine-specific DNA methylase
LRSLDYLTLKVKDAVCDRFRSACGKRPNVNTVRPDMQIHVYLDSNSYIFYLDTTGPALFHRSDHRSKVDAPLRENLAAGILHLCNWVPPTPLLDPMCGGGTLLIEAAQLALNIAPGLGRRFAFEKMANHDVSVFGQILEDARRVQLPLTRLPLFGSDKYGKALHEARENLAAAGLLEAVHLKQADILEISPPAEKGILLTNPPYGVRSSDHETLAVFYPRLGEVLKKKFTGWRACILTADTRLPRLIRLKPSRRIPLFNGALECRLYEFKLVAGSMRRVKTDV